MRLEGIKHKSLPKGGIGRSSNGNVVLTDFAVFIAPPAAERDESPVAESSDGNPDTDTQPEGEATDAEAGSTPGTEADTKAQAEETPDADTEVQVEDTPDAETQAESTPTADTDP